MLTRNWCEQASVCSLMPGANFLSGEKEDEISKTNAGPRARSDDRSLRCWLRAECKPARQYEDGFMLLLQRLACSEERRRDEESRYVVRQTRVRLLWRFVPDDEEGLDEESRNVLF